MDPVDNERARLVSMVWSSYIPHALHSLVSLGIVELLADGAASAEQLAQRSGTHAPSLFRLRRVAVSVGVVRQNGGLFALTDAGELLRSGVPGSVCNTVLRYGNAEGRRSWSELNYCVRTGQDAVHHIYGQDFFERLSTDPEQAAVFNGTMAET